MRKPILLALAILITFYSCTKIQTTDIGSGLIPSIDGVITKDTTLLVVTNTFNDDTAARIYKGDDHVIGVINNDPLFGKTTASTFLELKPAYYKYTFPGEKATLKIDSVVLVLSYKGIYGDSTVPQSFNVFEINQNSKLKYDSNYRTTDVITYGGPLLNTTNSFDLTKLDDSVNNRYEAASNQIRIKLTDNFKTRFLNYDTTNAYASDSLFRTLFGGFAIVPSGGGEALIRINLLDTNTKLAFYYSSVPTGGTVRDTNAVYFRFRYDVDANGALANTTSGNANTITRQRIGSRLNTFLNLPAPRSGNDSLVFIQTSPGTFVRVRLPNLSAFPNSIIHRAELIVEQVPDNAIIDKSQSPPRYIMLTVYDSVTKTKRNIPNDYVIDATAGPNIDQSGGFLTYKNVTGVGSVAAYNFNLTRFIQGVVTRKDTTYQLRLYAPSNDSITYSPPYPATGSVTSYISPSSANQIADGRVMLGGGSHSKLKMRLRIIYSRL